MPEKILVTGATGKLGGELIRRLLKRGVEVKAGTRSPERCAKLFADAVEVVHLDYDVTESWDAAVQWADRLFLVPPPFDPDADERLVPFIDWIVQSGSRHVVLVSAMGAEVREQLALHRVERHIIDTGVAWTLLRPNIYMQNFARGFVAASIRSSGVFRLSAGDGRVSFVDVRDVAEIASIVLGRDDDFGAAYMLTGPAALSHDEVAAAIAAAAGKPVRYEQIDDERMRGLLLADDWSAQQAATFVGLLEAIRGGERAAVSEETRALLGRAPTSFDTFARDHAEGWR
ncbi:MAG TPA: SDR family oxidoreductase [Longimicrobiales bacterium]|nr:SDR family oxidoreductase [Longimicrobiales bacterium]